VLVAAAVCPHPPLLVPEVAAGAAPELDTMRAACDEAVRLMLAANPDLVMVAGTGAETAEFGSGDAGTLAPYGIDVVVPLGAAPRGTSLPLSLTLGAWLLARAGWEGARWAYALDAAIAPADAAAVGSEVAERAPRVAVLAMGDGSACRTEQAPGYLDPRAAEADGDIAKALEAADVGALLALDPGLAAELMMAGRAAWQLLAGAAGDGSYDAHLLYDDAPYGVGSFVAVWTRR